MLFHISSHIFQTFTLEFQAQQTLGMQQPGEWYDEHRETLKKHAIALEVTLERIRDKVDSGYENLKSRIAALDFDAEQLAEEELADVMKFLFYFIFILFYFILNLYVDIVEY